MSFHAPYIHHIWIVLSSGQGISPVCDPLWPLTAFHDLEPWSHNLHSHAIAGDSDGAQTNLLLSTATKLEQIDQEDQLAMSKRLLCSFLQEKYLCSQWQEHLTIQYVDRLLDYLMMKYNIEYRLFVTLCVCKSKLIYHIYIYVGLSACHDAIVETKLSQGCMSTWCSCPTFTLDPTTHMDSHVSLQIMVNLVVTVDGLLF